MEVHLKITFDFEKTICVPSLPSSSPRRQSSLLFGPLFQKMPAKNGNSRILLFSATSVDGTIQLRFMANKKVRILREQEFAGFTWNILFSNLRPSFRVSSAAAFVDSLAIATAI